MTDKKSGAPGDPNISVADRMAIRSVVDAFALYWDSQDADAFVGLFTDDAYLELSPPGQDAIQLPLEAIRAAAETKFAENQASGTQQRHLFASMNVLSQTDTTAHIKQVALLSSTTGASPPSFASTMVYDFLLTKTDGTWSIKRYALHMDTSPSPSE